MHQVLLLPVLFPILCGTVMLILRPEDRRVRNVFLMTAVCLTSVMSAGCILLTYRLGGDATTCVMVHFSKWLSLSLKIYGVGMVYDVIVAILWPLLTLYAIEYMAHEGHESRFFGFWLVSFGVVNGIAFSQDFLSM